MNRSAVICAAGTSSFFADFVGINTAYLVRRATITSILSLPNVVLGSFVMKSIDISLNFLSDIGNGCSSACDVCSCSLIVDIPYIVVHMLQHRHTCLASNSYASLDHVCLL